MYYYHMLWFILLSIFLCFFFLRKIKQSKPILHHRKYKAFFYLLVLLIGLLTGTFIYILRKQFKTSYILISYEKYFIFLLFTLSVSSIIILALFTSNTKFDPKMVYAFCGIVVFFLLLCWAILSLPVTFGNVETETFYSDFNHVVNPFRQIYSLDIPAPKK